MTNKVHIENYKSIKSLDIESKRVNVFIGEPNSGKSNIIEALALLDPNALQGSNFQELFRFRSMGDFFYDSNIREEISVLLGDISATIKYSIPNSNCEIKVGQGEHPQSYATTTFSFNGENKGSGGRSESYTKFYQFKRLKQFENSNVSSLASPFGENLPAILLTNPELKKWVSEFIREKGFRLQLRPVENDISIAKEVNDELYSYPYSSISETLQRVIFLYTAIETNKDSILVFDEPEANTFPFYTKFIAERIGLSSENQFFLTTHNPYLLMNLIQKTPAAELNVCITKMQDYKTHVYPLSEKQIEKALVYDMDVFLNLDRLIEL